MNDKKILLNQYVPLIEKKMKMLESTLGNKEEEETDKVKLIQTDKIQKLERKVVSLEQKLQKSKEDLQKEKIFELKVLTQLDKLQKKVNSIQMLSQV